MRTVDAHRVVASGAQKIKTPATSYFIKRAVGIDNGSQRPGHSSAGAISLEHIYEIARVPHSALMRCQHHHEHACISLDCARAWGRSLVDILCLA